MKMTSEIKRTSKAGDLKNKDDLKRKTTLSGTVTLIQNWKWYQLSMPEMEFAVMKAIYARIFRKDAFLSKDN